MTSTQCSAPGKIILFGEHAVVYGQPAIAAPVSDLRAWATVSDAPAGATAAARPGVYIAAPDLGEEHWLTDSDEDDALAAAIRLVQRTLELDALPPLHIHVHSEIPIAGGLGSGAATAAALIRALARHLQRPELATDESVSDLTYDVEKIHHGTPSGIDNTVVALEKLVYFVRGAPRNHIEPFTIPMPLTLLVADTGVRSSTRVVVGDVRRQWQEDPARFDALFQACGRIARAARTALQSGDLPALGALMNENHGVLQQMTVSHPYLDRLVDAARHAGALGAKLSGAGRGGNMIALVTPPTLDAVRSALRDTGAPQVLTTSVR